MSKAKFIVKLIRRHFFYLIGIISYYSGFISLYINKKYRDKLLIVFYHEVGDRTDLFGNLTTKNAYFEKQIVFLKKHFTLIRAKDLTTFFSEDGCLLKNPALVTFDGGYKGNLTNAFPVLKKYSVPSLIYIVVEDVETGKMPWPARLSYIIRKSKTKTLKLTYRGTVLYSGMLNSEKKAISKIKAILNELEEPERDLLLTSLGKSCKVDTSDLQKRFLSWQELCGLASTNLVEIGSHSLTHPRLSQLSASRVEKEVALSKEIIEEKIKKKIMSFCYPWGSADKNVVKMVKEAGYSNATTTINGANDNHADPFMLKRYGGGNMPPFLFALKISGLFKKVII